MANNLTGQLKTTVAGIALASALSFSNAALAGEIALRSDDGIVNFVGEFVDFKDGNYFILTKLGELRISANRVRCEGDACPEIETAAANVATPEPVATAPVASTAAQATAGLSITDPISSGEDVMPLLMAGLTGLFDADSEYTVDFDSYFASTTNDSEAFTALLDGSAKVAMSLRRINDTEQRALRVAGAGNMVSPAQERIVAVDNMVVVTHPSNSVDKMSFEQLRGVFSGQITNWKQLGGSDQKITIVGHESDTSSYDFFMTQLFGDAMPGQVTQATGPNDHAVSSRVQTDPSAIGYVGQAFQENTQPVTLLGECGIQSMPDAFSAKTQEYPMNRAVYLYNRGDTVVQSNKAFLEFAVSDKVDEVIEQVGFIDMGILRRVQDESDTRKATLTAGASALAAMGAPVESNLMRDMLDEMSNNDRLSTTLRFRTGSSRLDDRGKFELQRLIKYLENEPKGTKITFVGFTDSVGEFKKNRNLSVGRANAALREVRRAARGRLNHIEMSHSGFGEIAPLACNTTGDGKALNRRVEIWISNEAAT